MVALFLFAQGVYAATYSVTVSDNAMVTLTWSSPTQCADGSTGDCNPTGYNVYYGTQPGVYTTELNAGNVLTYTLGPLSAGTYYFAVTAYDSTGESGYSNQVYKSIAYLGDTSSVSAIYAPAITEAATGSSTQSAMAIYAPSVTETATGADTPSATAIYQTSITEAASATDSCSAGNVPSITEAATATDSPSATANYLSSVTEAANATDLTDATIIRVASITEAATATDSTSAAGPSTNTGQGFMLFY